jgi:hypothetical protein
MTFIEYIKNHTIIEGTFMVYRCKVTGLSFGWEDANMQFDYLIKNKLI